MYDKDFRLHMAKHPTRSWAIILQQAWSVWLKDRIKFGQSSSKGQEYKQICNGSIEVNATQGVNANTTTGAHFALNMDTVS